MRHVLRLALIFSFLAFAGRAAAQAVPDRSLHGTVLDTSRAPVVGARVVASPDGPGTGPTAVTDARGEFTLALGPGSYDITISAPGFVTYVQRLAATKAGSESREFVLQVEGPRETVDVSAGGGYQVPSISSATRTPTPLRDVPQSVTVVTNELIKDQLMMSIGDVVRYVPGHQRAPGREQPRPGDHPRQQLLGRLLRQRRARRRAVLPRPLQPRSRRGAEGAERADLRPRRRRRRDQSRHQGGGLPAGARVHAAGREVRQQAGHADLDQPLDGHGRRSA